MGKRKRRGKIRIKQSAALVHKGDKTRVSRPDTARYRKAPTRVPSNGATFKVKIRRRND